jgi:septal ring factor EnvC (AmiA/AmiB activator)
MRMPARHRARAGRSIGGAEHRKARRPRTGLTRSNVTRLVALACFCALVAFPAAAHAQSTQQQLNATRHAIDITAQHWFAAQSKAAELDDHIARLERDIATAEVRVASAKQLATSLASTMYERASVTYTDMIGNDVIESARRAELIDRANAKNVSAIDELNSSLTDLRAQHKLLVRARSQQADALSEVASERASLETKLASLRDQAQREASAHVAGQGSHRAPQVHAAASGNAVVAAFPTAPSRAPAAVTTPTPVAASPPPSGRGGTSPHHNDPFLTCTRARESNGIYTVVSSSGYYGAYQFSPSTWDVTASHAGRLDLIGELPSRASAYDQDEQAWTLYQWQGKGPWGGRC